MSLTTWWTRQANSQRNYRATMAEAFPAEALSKLRGIQASSQDSSKMLACCCIIVAKSSRRVSLDKQKKVVASRGSGTHSLAGSVCWPSPSSTASVGRTVLKCDRRAQATLSNSSCRTYWRSLLLVRPRAARIASSVFSLSIGFFP